MTMNDDLQTILVPSKSNIDNDYHRLRNRVLELWQLDNKYDEAVETNRLLINEYGGHLDDIIMQIILLQLTGSTTEAQDLADSSGEACRVFQRAIDSLRETPWTAD